MLGHKKSFAVAVADQPAAVDVPARRHDRDIEAQVADEGVEMSPRRTVAGGRRRRPVQPDGL